MREVACIVDGHGSVVFEKRGHGGEELGCEECSWFGAAGEYIVDNIVVSLMVSRVESGGVDSCDGVADVDCLVGGQAEPLYCKSNDGGVELDDCRVDTVLLKGCGRCADAGTDVEGLELCFWGV